MRHYWTISDFYLSQDKGSLLNLIIYSQKIKDVLSSNRNNGSQINPHAQVVAKEGNICATKWSTFLYKVKLQKSTKKSFCLGINVTFSRVKPSNRCACTYSQCTHRLRVPVGVSGFTYVRVLLQVWRWYLAIVYFSTAMLREFIIFKNMPIFHMIDFLWCTCT